MDPSRSDPHATQETDACTFTQPEAVHCRDAIAGGQGKAENSIGRGPVLVCSPGSSIKKDTSSTEESQMSPMVSSQSQSSEDGPTASTTPEGSVEKEAPNGETSPSQDLVNGAEEALNDEIRLPERVGVEGREEDIADGDSDDASVYSQEPDGEPAAVPQSDATKDTTEGSQTKHDDREDVPEAEAAKNTAGKRQASSSDNDQAGDESGSDTNPEGTQGREEPQPGPPTENEPAPTPEEALPEIPVRPDEGEKYVDFIHRKRRVSLARKAAIAEAAKRRAQEEEEAASEAERAANPPKPAPEPVAELHDPNLHLPFTTTRPGDFSLGLRTPARFYRQAHVLTVGWAPQPPAAVRALRDVLGKHYGFGLGHCGLPVSRDAPKVLAAALARVVADYGDITEKTLIVVHYAGVSRTDERSFRICPPAWLFCPPVVEVDMHSVLCDTLFAGSFAPDVLVLLDCPYAVQNDGVACAGKEILAASTRPSGFSLSDPATHRFTRGVAKRLGAAMESVSVYTDELEASLAEDAPKPRNVTIPKLKARQREAQRAEREARVRAARAPGGKGVAGLRTGLGPVERYILIAPVVGPRPYRPPKRKWWRAEMDGACEDCLMLRGWDGFAHRCKCGWKARKARDAEA